MLHLLALSGSFVAVLVMTVVAAAGGLYLAAGWQGGPLPFRAPEAYGQSWSQVARRVWQADLAAWPRRWLALAGLTWLGIATLVVYDRLQSGLSYLLLLPVLAALWLGRRERQRRLAQSA